MAYRKYFVNCKGVFQGGGCKAIAFIGAYQQALESGICFSGFAGTSAGSIVAALISAGATPKELNQFVSQIDFKALENSQTQEKIGFKKKILQTIINVLFREIPTKYVKMLPVVFEKLGYHDTGIIRDMLEKELKRLLNKREKIKFRDLKYPLMIVASDIINHEIKIWSNKDTPNDSVAFAVEASCAIPIVYKPVSGRYVDGGLLCNLPTIVFPDKETCFDKVLAFTFKTNKGRKPENNSIESYIEKLASTIVEGSTDIQKKLRKKVDFITIEPYFDSLDFDKVNSRTIDIAIANGRNAVVNYLSRQNQIGLEMHREDPLSRKEHIRAHVAYNTYQRNDYVVVALPDLSWTWDMFLSILKWKQDNSRIDIYTEASVEADIKEESRVRMLLHMGIGIHYVETLPLYGYFFYKEQRWSGVSLIYKGSDNKDIIGRSYNSDVDEKILNFVVSSLPTISVRYLEPLAIQNIKLKAIDENIIISRLRKIKHYNQCNITFEDVEVSSVLFMTKYVLGYKYRPMEELIKSYEKYPIYGAAAFEFADSKLSLIGPPVVEVWNDKYIIINGNTRFLYAYNNGISHLRCVVVKGVTTELITGDRFTPSEVIISDKTLHSSSRYSNWTQEKYRELYRPIESYMRNPQTYLLD